MQITRDFLTCYSCSYYSPCLWLFKCSKTIQTKTKFSFIYFFFQIKIIYLQKSILIPFEKKKKSFCKRYSFCTNKIHFCKKKKKRKFILQIKKKIEKIIQEKNKWNNKWTDLHKWKWKSIQSSPAVSNSEGTRQKVRDSAIFEIARLRDSEITLGNNSR